MRGGGTRCAPDAADAADDRAYERRRFTHTPTYEGQFHSNGCFDAEGGATIAAALDAFSHPDPPETPAELRRSPAQRRADALVEIARQALDAGTAGDVAGVRPHVVARANLSHLHNPEGGHVVTFGSAEPACAERSPSRDRGCRFAGCDRPPAWCDIDHVVPVTKTVPRRCPTAFCYAGTITAPNVVTLVAGLATRRNGHLVPCRRPRSQRPAARRA